MKGCTRNEVVTFLDFSEQTLTNANTRRITSGELKGLPYPKYCRTIYAIILTPHHTATGPAGGCFQRHLEMSKYVIHKTYDFPTLETGRRPKNKYMDRK